MKDLSAVDGRKKDKTKELVMGSNAKMFAQVIGIVLVAIGLLDFVSPGIYGLLDDQTLFTNGLHVIGGAWVAYIGFSGSEASQMKAAQVLGVIGLVAAVLGFVAPGILATLSITDGTNFNIVHALIGLAGVYVGWMGKKA